MPYTYISTPATTIGNEIIWSAWNQTYTTTSVTSNIVVWQNINAGYVTEGTVIYADTVPVDFEAQIECREIDTLEARQARQARADAHMEERRAARCRAEALLEHFLTDEERRCWRENDYIPVVSSTGRLFHIITTYGHTGNVWLMDEDDTLDTRYCVHSPEDMPDPDHWLAQKLGLEADEDSMMAVANVY